MSLSSLKPSMLDRWRQKSITEFIPLQASLELTNKCNERCGHCYLPSFSDKKEKVLGLDQWRKILSDLRLAGTFYIVLMGGEAMLNPLFWDILKSSSKMGFHTSMITNGLKIRTPQVAQRLKELGLQRATFSLYSMDNEIHDDMTHVSGSFERTMNAIKYCEQANIEISINSLLTKRNAPKIFDVYDWCLSKKYDLNVDPNVTAKLNGDLSPTQLRADEATLKWYFEELTHRWPMGRPKKSNARPEDYNCNAAKGKCAITAYGELLPCIEIRESLGSLVSESFIDLWLNSPAVKKWRDFRVQDIDAKNSDFCDHCPGMSENELGNPKKRLPFTNLIASVKRQVYEAQEKNLSTRKKGT